MKIAGIGNALVDVLVRLEDDSVLKELGLQRGGMFLIDDAKHAKISVLLDTLHPAMTTGGSAGNTILALANLHANPGFIGKIGHDKTGQFFAENCKQCGINAILLYGNEASGIANTFISKDGERTFATHLGAAASMKAEDVKQEWFEGYNLLHLEGYLVQNHELIERIAQVAKDAGQLISIDLASFNIVRENLDFMHHLVREYVDIIFANQEESEAFTGLADSDCALQAMAKMASIAVVKLGGQGSCVMSKGEKTIVPSNKVSVVDTTAAGDFFAGGFLYAYSQGAPLESCLKCGTLLAGQAIQVVGTRLSEETWEEIRKQTAMILARP